MRNRLDQFVPGHAVLQGLREVKPQLLRTVQRDQGADGNEAAIALGEPGSLPDVAKEYAVGQFHQLRRKIADQLLGYGRFSDTT